MSKLTKKSHQDEKQEAIIFGAGKAGESAYKNLKADYSIVAFADNASTKQGLTLMGLPIKSPQDIESHDAVIFIASEFYEQIKAQLITATSIEASRLQAIPPRLLKPMAFANDVCATGLLVLKTLCDSLESCNILYHIDAGTLLGLYRDGKLIPWDDDLDIAIEAAFLSQIDSHLVDWLAMLNEKTGLDWRAEKYFSEHSFGNVSAGDVRSYKLYSKDTETVPSIDLFIKYVNAEHSDYCLASRGIRMPSKLTKTTELLTVKGQQWRMPSAVESYLQCHYGDNWHVPDPNWSLQDLNNAEVFGVHS